MTKFYPMDWDKRPDRYVYLGSEVNPRTQYKYDYYAVHTWPENDNAEMRWSFAYRFGCGPSDYGSGPVCIIYEDYTEFGDEIKKDHMFGSIRSQQLTLYFLATGKKPLLDY